MKSKKQSRRQARKIWEKYNKACILPGMHIHHMDGNAFNNDPDNLLICTPKEHWQIHFDQNDIVAKNGKFIQGASDAGKLGGKAKPNKETKDKQRESAILRWTDPREREKQRLRMLKRKDILVEKTIKTQGGKPFQVWKAIGKRYSWKKGEFIGEFINKTECSKLFNVSRSHIRMCLNGKIKQINGYIFELSEK